MILSRCIYYVKHYPVMRCCLKILSPSVSRLSFQTVNTICLFLKRCCSLDQFHLSMLAVSAFLGTVCLLPELSCLYLFRIPVQLHKIKCRWYHDTVKLHRPVVVVKTTIFLTHIIRPKRRYLKIWMVKRSIFSFSVPVIQFTWLQLRLVFLWQMMVILKRLRRDRQCLLLNTT